MEARVCQGYSPLTIENMKLKNTPVDDAISSFLREKRVEVTSSKDYELKPVPFVRISYIRNFEHLYCVLFILDRVEGRVRP